ncbi:unnamed protein product [Caenorhabditis angaria]|uniref:Uncharacterized protein n=1 Tax=Caenorhabditis angaria TaxID=860376 RepID=A0A9P1IY72_9PELO|nr:unnamed protein product [Caenorhabditis angaria]
MELEHWSDYYSMAWNYSFGTVGVVMNSILLFVIQKKTPEYMRTYSFVLQTGSCWDLVTAFSGIIASARYFATGKSAVLMFHGLGKYFPFERETNSRICFTFFTIEVHGFLFSIFIIIFCLYYRKRAVTRSYDPISKISVQIFCITSTICMFIYTVLMSYLHLIPISTINALLEEARPELINSTWNYFAIMDLSAFPDFLTEGFALSQSTIVMIYLFYCRHKILKTLKTLHLSPATMELQKSLMKILLIQTFIPAFHILFTIPYTIVTFTNTTQTAFFENSVETTVLVLAAVTPIITIWFIKPYRFVLAKLFGPDIITPILVVSQNSLYVDDSAQI